MSNILKLIPLALKDHHLSDYKYEFFRQSQNL